MENNYWIEDELLIFKPSFNDDLKKNYNIINKYKKIMFSNYNEPLIAIKTNNKYDNIYEDNYISASNMTGAYDIIHYLTMGVF